MTNSIEQQFNNPTIFGKIKDRAEEFIVHLQIPEARKLADSLEEKLKAYNLASQNSELYEEYQKVILRLRLVSLPIYDNDTVLELIKNHFLDGLKMGLDMNDRMTGKMYSVPILVWPELSQELVRALKENQQRIGFQSIKNWLSDYSQKFGPEKHSSLEQHQYINQNPNIKNLNEQEKNWLLQLLQFYDNLKPLAASLLENKTPKEFSNLTPPSTPSPIRPQPIPPLSRSPMPQPTAPKPPQSPLSQFPKQINLRQDKYQEPVAETPESDQVEPRIEGNIVDLKRES